MKVRGAFGLAAILGTAILVAQACALPAYSTSSSSGAGGAGAAGGGTGAGGPGGAGGAGGAATTSTGGGGGAGGGSACPPVDDYEVIACNQNNPGPIVIVENDVYWATEAQAGGTVWRASKTGGEPVMVAGTAALVCWMDSHLQRVAWRTTAGEVSRFAVGDSQPATVVMEAPTDRCQVAVDQDDVYWFAQNPWRIERAAMGGSPAPVTDTSMPGAGQPNSSPLGLDVSNDLNGHYVFWGEAETGRVFWLNLSPPNDTNFFLAGTAVAAIAAENSYVYMSEHISNEIRMAIAGTGGTVPLAAQQNLPGPIRYNSTHVFWLNQPALPSGYAELRRTAKVQSVEPGEVMSAGVTRICGLAVEDQWLYLTDCAAGLVLRKPLP